jgi:hypothetical protein
LAPAIAVFLWQACQQVKATFLGVHACFAHLSSHETMGVSLCTGWEFVP